MVSTRYHDLPQSPADLFSLSILASLSCSGRPDSLDMLLCLAPLQPHLRAVTSHVRPIRGQPIRSRIYMASAIRITMTDHSAHMTSLLLTTDPAPPDALLSRGLNSDLETNLFFVLFSLRCFFWLYLLLLPTRSPSVSLMGSSRPETLSKSRSILRKMITEAGNRCTVNRKLRNSVERN